VIPICVFIEILLSDHRRPSTFIDLQQRSNRWRRNGRSRRGIGWRRDGV